MRRTLLAVIGLLALWIATAGTIVTPDVVIVDSTADLQAAVDALDATAGGEIHLAPGTFTLTAPLLLDRPVRLIGAGQYATYIYSADPDSDIIRVTASGVSLRDLTIYGPGESGSGIGLLVRSAQGGYLRSFEARNVTVDSTGSWGVALIGPGYMDTSTVRVWSGDNIHPVLDHVTVYDAMSGGTLYSGHGVATPSFNECNFTGTGSTAGPANNSTMADSLEAWHWFLYRPSFQSVTDSTVLHRGHVYLCATTDARFDGCIFQNRAAGEPMLSFEDCISPLVSNSYFEAYDSTRINAMVTMNHTQGFVIENAYARSAYAAPLRFLRTNSNSSSGCYGSVRGFWGYQGDATQSVSVAEKKDDFVFNTSGDAKAQGAVSISNSVIVVEDATGSYKRNVDARQFSGGASFSAQNILFESTNNRIALPKVPYDSLSTTASVVQAGQLLYAQGGGSGVGSRGGLLLGLDNANWYAVPSCPVLSDTSTASGGRDWLFPSPRSGDRCFVLNYYGSNLGVEMIYDGTAWRHQW